MYASSELIITDKGNPLRNFNIYMNIEKAKNNLNYHPKKLDINLKKMIAEKNE